MTVRVLLLGGHGQISQLMTPLFLNRSYDVVSVIRNPAHKQEILDLAAKSTTKASLEVLVESVEDVKTAEDAKKLIEKTQPTYVVWSAGKSAPPQITWRGLAEQLLAFPMNLHRSLDGCRSWRERRCGADVRR